MAQHIVSSFEAEMRSLGALIVDMGVLVGRQIEGAAEALRALDADIANGVIAEDRKVDEIQRRIEDLVIHIIARRTPVAIDLRETIATLKIATDLERIGDLAKNNAKRVLAMGVQSRPAGVGANLDALTDRVQQQLADVMQAFARRDKALAESVWLGDAHVDQLQTALFRELVTYMMEDPRSIGYSAHLLFCAKNLERIGDHATNIAEAVHFIATGYPIAGDRPKGPGSASGLLPETGAGQA